MVLVDTSIWIETFRKGGLALTTVVPFDDVVTAPPIVQEVLSGFRDDVAHRKARLAFLNLPIVGAPLPLDVFLEASDLYRTARRKGITIRSTVDCVIAVLAIRNDLTVLHRDRDFDALARVSSLTVRRA